MKDAKITFAILISLFVSACRIEVPVSAGGSVSTISGSMNCAAGSTCTLDVADTLFDETFVAQAAPGFEFVSWKSGSGRLCRGSTEPCRYSTSRLEGNAAAIALLSDPNVVLYVEPVFVSQDAEPEELLGATLICPWDQSDPTLHTFIVAGQSDMTAYWGWPGTLPAVYETGIDQLQMWDNGSWKRLGLSTENTYNALRYGPEIAFAWTMHAACPESNIGIIKYAAGGSSIDTWVPGGTNHTELFATSLLLAYAAHPDITFQGFLFDQGIADMKTLADAESWDEKYLSLVDHTRSNIIVPNDLPFIHATIRREGLPDDFGGIDPDSIPPQNPFLPFEVHLTLSQWMVQFERPGIYPSINRDLPGDGIHSYPDGIRLNGRNLAATYIYEAN